MFTNAEWREAVPPDWRDARICRGHPRGPAETLERLAVATGIILEVLYMHAKAGRFAVYDPDGRCLEHKRFSKFQVPLDEFNRFLAETGRPLIPVPSNTRQDVVQEELQAPLPLSRWDGGTKT